MLARTHADAVHTGEQTVIVPLTEYDFLKRALVAHSGKEAIVCGNTRLTYGQFGRRVNQWANAIRGLGVQKGDRVAMLSQNCHRVLEAFFGTPLLGSILMPLNFRLLPDHFHYILHHCGEQMAVAPRRLKPLIGGARSPPEKDNHEGPAASDG